MAVPARLADELDRQLTVVQGGERERRKLEGERAAVAGVGAGCGPVQPASLAVV